MSDQHGEDTSAEAIARKLIAQCRTDLNAAWNQLEAARASLAHSRPRVDAQRTAPGPAPDGAGADAAAPKPAAAVRKRRRRRRAKSRRS
jgi:hypothetical protein